MRIRNILAMTNVETPQPEDNVLRDIRAVIRNTFHMPSSQDVLDVGGCQRRFLLHCRDQHLNNPVTLPINRFFVLEHLRCESNISMSEGAETAANHCSYRRNH